MTRQLVRHHERALVDVQVARAEPEWRYRHLGDAYNSIDELPSALSAYEAAAQLEPGNDRALKRIGVVLDRMGRPAEAAAAYQRARAATRK